MFAIIRTGGKQYKVQPEQVITVERLSGEVGDTLSFETVLMVGEGNISHIGDPFLKDALVKARLLEQTRADKVIVFKKKRRHNYRRKQGHRQDQSVIRILEISGPDSLKTNEKTGDSSQHVESKPKALAPQASSSQKNPSKKSSSQTTDAKPDAKPPSQKASTDKSSSKKESLKASPKKPSSKV